MNLAYPSTDFIKHAGTAIRSGQTLTVVVDRGWRARLLTKEIMRWPKTMSEINDREAQWRPPSLRVQWPMMGFHFAYTFAMAGEYKMMAELEGGMVRVTYVPIDADIAANQRGDSAHEVPKNTLRSIDS